MVENTERNDLVPIVGPDFAVPMELRTENTVLRPLRAEHNEADYAAWMSSIDHIRATPGFGDDRTWPDPEMPLTDNLRDLVAHSQHFDDRVGFTYTVLDPADESQVLGCVYIYDAQPGSGQIDVRSWVVGARPELDAEVYAAVSSWLRDEWPFTSVAYTAR